MTIKIVKNEVKSFITNPNKDENSVLVGSGYRVLNCPASQFAAAFARNHVPINKEANRRGASFVTIESPIGDRDNSPKVCSV